MWDNKRQKYGHGNSFGKGFALKSFLLSEMLMS